MNAKAIDILKRDGAVEPFSAAKLRRCIARALREAECDQRIADPLARAVETHLRDRSEPEPASADYVFRCLHAALTQTGMGDAAECLGAHRRRRAAQRKAIQVVDRRRPGEPAQAWKKSRVCEQLVNARDLNPTTARIIAGEVEMRLMALNYRLVSTSLVSELIENELATWGLAGEAVEPSRAVPVLSRTEPKEQ